MQRKIIRALKADVFNGLNVIVLAIPHHAHSLTDVEVETEGRATHIRIPYWNLPDLLLITRRGFGALELAVPHQIQRRICEDGFGSPLLVQEICLNYHEEITSGVEVDRASFLTAAYNRLIIKKGLDRYDRLLDFPVGDKQPALIRMLGGERELLHTVLLTAISRLGPKPESSYADIRVSLTSLVADKAPEQDDVIQILTAMSEMLSDGRAAPLEWLSGRQLLVISDPLMMFYMRWVLRDRRTIYLPSSVEGAVGVVARGSHGRTGGDP